MINIILLIACKRRLKWTLSCSMEMSTISRNVLAGGIKFWHQWYRNLKEVQLKEAANKDNMKKGADSAPVFCPHLCWAHAHRWFWSETPVVFERPFELWWWREENLTHTLGLLFLPWRLCLRTFLLIYRRLWTNPFHHFIIFFSTSKTYSGVLLALMCFWLDYSSVKLAAFLEWKEGDWAEAVQRRWPLSAAAGTRRRTAELPPLWKPAAAQSEILLRAWNWKAQCFSKVFFSPKGNRYWDFRWHLLTIWIQEINKTIKTFP